jgi:hypothetical protein
MIVRRALTVQGGYMNKGMSAALLVVGVILLVFGLNAYHSASSDVSRFFTGAPTDKALWLLIGGVVASIVGFLGLARK